MDVPIWLWVALFICAIILLIPLTLLMTREAPDVTDFGEPVKDNAQNTLTEEVQ